MGEEGVCCIKILDRTDVGNHHRGGSHGRETVRERERERHQPLASSDVGPKLGFLFFV